MYFRHIQHLSLLVLSSFLSGCAIYKQAFDCEAGQGVGCQSISQVNDLVDQGKLDAALDEKTAKEGGSPDDRLPLSLTPNLEELPSLPAAIPDSHSDGAFVKRAQEETLRIWIAPFEDKSGDFQGESFVHTVIKPGRWISVMHEDS